MATVSLAGRDVTVSNIFCIGRNYAAHVAELGNRPEAEPLVFLKADVGAAGRWRAD